MHGSELSFFVHYAVELAALWHTEGKLIQCDNDIKPQATYGRSPSWQEAVLWIKHHIEYYYALTVVGGSVRDWCGFYGDGDN